MKKIIKKNYSPPLIQVVKAKMEACISSDQILLMIIELIVVGGVLENMQKI